MKILWHVDLLLDNGRETNNSHLLGNGSANKHVSMAVREHNNYRRDVFYAVHADML
jgi:hypothetical protein